MDFSDRRPAARDPRDVLRENPLPPEPGLDPRAETPLDELLEEVQDWMRRRIRRRARETGLDPDDLHQEVRLSLLRRSAEIEPHNPGVRTWLSVRIEWTVVDLLRRRGRERPHAPDVLDASAQDHPDPRPTAEENAARYRLDVAHLVSMGLPRHQAEVVALRCHGDDLPLKEFAQLVRRSYAAVRQDLHRGLRRIESLFDLTVREGEVVRAFRRHGTAAAAAPRLGLAQAEFTCILEDAHKKIDQVFSEREGRP
jgi:RNA polymerase sigma factor (sigma-70 family)